MGPDCHFFRQDTDAYMMAAAVRHGATIRQQTRIVDFEVKEDIARLVSTKGEVFTGSYLVDATGMKSVLAHKFELRDDSTQYLTNSRAIFTHMINVEHYDNVGHPREEYKLKYPLSQSTLHHIFEGGWMWVIPLQQSCRCGESAVQRRPAAQSRAFTLKPAWTRKLSSSASCAAFRGCISSSPKRKRCATGWPPAAFSTAPPVSTGIATACFPMPRSSSTRSSLPAWC